MNRQPRNTSRRPKDPMDCCPAVGIGARSAASANLHPWFRYRSKRTARRLVARSEQEPSALRSTRSAWERPSRPRVCAGAEAVQGRQCCTSRWLKSPLQPPRLRLQPVASRGTQARLREPRHPGTLRPVAAFDAEE
eukprot:6260355-Pyramimonas_sp.AAC.1